jgi:hypothetical protein
MRSAASGAAGRGLTGRLSVLLGVAAFAFDQWVMLAQAAPFRQVAAGVATFASDGARYVAWEAKHGSPVIVLDTRTRRRSMFALSRGCALVGQRERPKSNNEAVMYGWPAAAGRFLVACGIRQRLLLIATSGATTTLPAYTGPYEDGWESVGTQYVVGNADSRLCPRLSSGAEQLCLSIYDIATGAVSHRPRSQFPDLDRSGAPPICAKLRKKVIVAQEQSPAGGEFAYHDGILIKAAGRAGDLRLEHCQGRATILGAPGEPENFDARAGLLTWDTGQAAEDHAREEPAGSGWLFSYALATHRRGHWRLPRASLSGEEEGLPTSGFFGYATHTRSMVFWIAARYCHDLGGAGCQTETSSVYAATLR